MTQHSAVRRLHEFGRLFPGIWDDFARMLAAVRADGTTWSSWCYCPLAGAHAVLARGADMPPERAPLTAEAAGLAAWRATQGIYRIHPTLLEELLQTPITADIPVDVLLRLPEWCVYVELPGPEFVGFFAYLEQDANDGRAELRFLLDSADPTRPLAPFAVHLNRGSVRAGLESALATGRDNHLRLAPFFNQLPEHSFEAARDSTLRAAPLLERLLSAVLYLCAEDVEVPPAPAPPPRVVTGRKRPILPSPKHGARVYECGTRLGPLLAAAQQRMGEPNGSGSTAHNLMPHIRRAHWHTYWTGPREGERVAKLRWLHPIRVNLDAGAVPDAAVVRRVPDVGGNKDQAAK